MVLECRFHLACMNLSRDKVAGLSKPLHGLRQAVEALEIPVTVQVAVVEMSPLLSHFQ